MMRFQSCGVYSVEHNFLGIAWIVLRLVADESSHSSGSNPLLGFVIPVQQTDDRFGRSWQLFLTPFISKRVNSHQESIWWDSSLAGSTPSNTTSWGLHGLFWDWYQTKVHVRAVPNHYRFCVIPVQQTGDRFGRSWQLYLTPFISKRANSHQEFGTMRFQSCGVYSVKHNFLGIAWILLRVVPNESSCSSGSKSL